MMGSVLFSLGQYTMAAFLPGGDLGVIGLA